jgi:hypothetical protein
MELVFASNSGAEIRPFSIAVESRYPFYSEGSLHCGNLIGDGRPHAYQVELPFSLLFDLHVFFSGIEVDDSHRPYGLRIYPATLTVPGLPPKTLSTITFAGRSPAGATFAYRSVFAFED